MKKSEFLFTIARIINDGITILGGLIFAYFLRMNEYEIFKLDPPIVMSFSSFFSIALPITIGMMVIFAIHGRYRFREDERIWDEFRHIFWTFSAGMALVLVFFFFKRFTFFSRFIFGMAWIASLAFMILGRIMLRLVRQIFYHLGYGRARIIVLGTGPIAKQAIQTLCHNKKFNILGILSEKAQEEKIFKGYEIIGSFENFENAIKQKGATEVLIAVEHSTEKITARLVRIAHIHGVKLKYLPDELGLDLAAVTTSTLGNLPLITLQNTLLDGWGYVLKSLFDQIIALGVLLVLSPFLILTGILIKWENPRAAILYKSKRVGKNGKIFLCFKFRTMIPDADQKKKELMCFNERNVFFKIKNDPRITTLGNFLRKTSIDELPQLLNVLRGQMSLIGPRPHLPEEVGKYQIKELRVLSIKPGITGFSQINGRSSLSFEEEMQYEIFYIKNWSLFLDLFIFLKSLYVVLKRKNVS